jgi:hypothetical protein
MTVVVNSDKLSIFRVAGTPPLFLDAPDQAEKEFSLPVLGIEGELRIVRDFLRGGEALFRSDWGALSGGPAFKAMV